MRAHTASRRNGDADIVASYFIPEQPCYMAGTMLMAMLYGHVNPFSNNMSRLNRRVDVRRSVVVDLHEGNSDVVSLNGDNSGAWDLNRDNSGVKDLNGDNLGVEDLHGDNSGVVSFRKDNLGVSDLHGDNSGLIYMEII